MNIYFDNAATTKVDDEVLSSILPYFQHLYGNPSVNNYCGKQIRDSLDGSRLEVATYLNCAPNEIIFTSGATESNNLVLKSCEEICSSSYENENPSHFIFSSIEHKSVLSVKDYLETHGHKVDLILTLSDGRIDLNDLIEKIQENTVLVSCLYVNNETGIIQPIDEIADICKKYGLIFHTDATQAYGKLLIDLSKKNIDFLSLSAHKLHGPKGVGALYKSNQINLKCQILGGSQEDGYRSGTENVPGIIGLGKATEIASKNLLENYRYFQVLERYFLKKLKYNNIQYIINGDLEYKVPWIFNIAFLDTTAETLINKLGGFCFSKSSACSKGNKPSHVLQSMGVDDDIIDKSIRLSFSKYTTIDQIDIFFEKLSNII